MAKCELCGKISQTGHNVSHSKRRTNTRWYPNIHRTRLLVNGVRRPLKVCTRCLRSYYRAPR